MWICKYCKEEFDCMTTSGKANHSRWCHKNPRSHDDRAKLMSGSKCKMRDAITEQSRTKQSKSLRLAHRRGAFDESAKNRRGKPGHKHKDEVKEIIRQKALQSKHRRLVKSCRVYHRKDGSSILLDSSWEEALAKRLDELGVEWTRPEPIRWVDTKGITHNYFPDFYLPEYDVFIDPKNPAAIQSQKEKLSIITEQIPNLLILDSLNGCINYAPVAQRN